MGTGKVSTGAIVKQETVENGWLGMGRVLTIQIEITDKEAAAWIWESHMGDYSEHGVYVQAIHEGPIPKEIEDEDD